MADMEITKTKERIMDESLILFAKNEYNDVTMREIARAVGIKVSSIYNHYKSKDEILMSIYEYYVWVNELGRESKKEAGKNIQDLTTHELVRMLIKDPLDNLGRKEQLRMHLTRRLLYYRMFIDETAKKLFLQNMNKDIEFIEKCLNLAVELGKYVRFDTNKYAVICEREVIMKRLLEFVDPEQEYERLIEDQKLVEFLTDLLDMNQV